MRAYHERLHVPAAWWLAGLAAVALLGAELAAGFGWLVALIIYLVIGSGYALLLVSWGRVSVGVGDGELTAGRARLPLPAVGDVAELDPAQTRALRGPNADPAALIVMRPYLRRAVYVEVTDPSLGSPYWLVSTRHPAELAAAITRSLPSRR